MEDTTLPLPLVFPFAVPFWLTLIWAYAPEYRIVHRSRQHVRQPGSRDAGSLQLILFGMSVATIAAFPLAWIPALRVPDRLELAAFAIGVAVLLAGSLLRRHCWRVLGSYFTGDVVAAADQPVIDRGAYAYLRHPAYTAGTLMNIGIGLALGSWGSTILLAVSSVAVYLYRIRVEERVLLATIGEPYRRYISTRKRLVPFVY